MQTEVSILTNRLDPEGTGFTIAAEEAPSSAARQAMQQRMMVLNRALAPIGQKGAAAEVMALSIALKLRGKTAADAEATLDLADLPAFAVIEACQDYQQGRAGDRKWLPEFPALRVHALSKQRAAAAERAQVDRVLKARVRDPRATAEQRAATVAMARHVAATIAMAGRRAEAERAGCAVEEEIAPEPERPEQALERLARLRDERPVKLVPDLRRKELISRGIDVEALDEAERVRQVYAEQQERFA